MKFIIDVALSEREAEKLLADALTGIAHTIQPVERYAQITRCFRDVSDWANGMVLHQDAQRVKIGADLYIAREDVK